MAGPISSLLSPAHVITELQNTKRTAALHEIATTLKGCAEITDFDGFYQELLARDRLDTTSLGNGVALPHSRTEHVKSIVMAVGRSSVGIPFDQSNENVRLLFVLGTPKSKPGEYLKLVSAICKLLKDPALRETYLSAPTPEAFIGAIVAAENKLFPGV